MVAGPCVCGVTHKLPEGFCTTCLKVKITKRDKSNQFLLIKVVEKILRHLQNTPQYFGRLTAG